MIGLTTASSIVLFAEATRVFFLGRGGILEEILHYVDDLEEALMQ